MVAGRIGQVIGAAAIGLAAMLVAGAASAPARPEARGVARPVAAVAASPRPAVLDDIRPGLWEIAADGPGASPRRLCVDAAEALVQIAHPGAACSRLVVADAEHRATVHYSCPGAGWGRTSLRVGADGDVAIDTQGIAANAPFAWAATARRAGDCRR